MSVAALEANVLLRGDGGGAQERTFRRKLLGRRPPPRTHSRQCQRARWRGLRDAQAQHVFPSPRARGVVVSHPLRMRGPGLNPQRVHSAPETALT